ncbi:metallophosphoesterase [Clostridium peptidivorans]|uniref:metallophosphoesterase n=1 Tax=Clostridium peptidivorans TaxID=100174 RepID=UPI0015CE901D|nr:metallophosphoesterase [Clostridium peptidivorans]
MKLNASKIVVLSLIAVVCISFFYFQNNLIETSYYTLKFKKMPEKFDNFKIIHISDLHSKEFGKRNRVLLDKIAKEKPNFILITGDIIDRRNYNEEPSLYFAEQCMKIAPVYFSTGNHEMWSGKLNGLEEKMKNIGVSVLRNESNQIKIGDESIYILGIDDPVVYKTKEEGKVLVKNIKSSLKNVPKDSFKILLSHRPERIDIYENANVDLILSGHAHGGQIRLPYIGGILAPGQGFFPKYEEGVHNIGSAKIEISRGLGNSSFPLRVFNRPELVVISLKK